MGILSLRIQGQFLNEQLRFERVRDARDSYQADLEKQLKTAGYSLGNVHLALVAYKEEKRLDVYLKTKQGKRFVKWKSLVVCASSGVLGPKFRQGDAQVPEGLYHIDRFNPNSLYYLSLGLNYPNGADRVRSAAKDLGGDIFIHGKCVTIGCLPMTDEIIAPLYLLAVHARNNGQKQIPVYIFPFEMAAARLKQEAASPHAAFWKSLKAAHDLFLELGVPVPVRWDEKGNYSLQN